MPSHVPNVLDPFDGIDHLSREQRAEMAAGYRKLADWLETSEFPIPRTVLFSDGLGLQIAGSWYSDPDFLTRPGSAARLMGGKVIKSLQYNWMPDSDFVLTRDFGGEVKVSLRIPRQAVCTPREETTTTKVEVPVDGARAEELKAEQERIKAELAELETFTITRPTTRTVFDCPESLVEAERKTEAAV